MKKKILFLRISFWVGAILDFLRGIEMIFNDIFVNRMGMDTLKIDSYSLGLGTLYGAGLMFGWTILLIWADRKPLERRGVLLITIFPVVIVSIFTHIFTIVKGIVPFEKAIVPLIIQAILTTLYLFSYFYSRKTIQNGTNL